MSITGTPADPQPPKPIYVRVAEALGWADCRYELVTYEWGAPEWHWMGGDPDLHLVAGQRQRTYVPRFGEEGSKYSGWSTLGPIAERRGWAPSLMRICQLILEAEKAGDRP